MNQLLTSLQSRDADALLHPYTNAAMHRQIGAHVIERGEGIYVYDTTGKKYIEGMAGLWCCGLGFGDEELVDAAREQLGKLPYYHLFGGRSHEPAIELAEKLKALMPGMERVFYQSSGSEANDTQVKLAWYYNNALGRPDKKKIISRVRGYHGVTIVAASLTGLPYNHKSFDLPVGRILHTSMPHFWRAAHDGETEGEFTARLARELEELIMREGPETIAAFIAEPVMGAGGVIVPPEGYFEAIMPILQEYDILCIADEVICGFGRTGEMFGHHKLNMQPTSVSVAKQLTGGYAPLSAVAINGEMTEAIERHTGEIGLLGHGYTYGGHPLGCAVGVKALEIYETRNILAHVQGLQDGFQAKLRSYADHPLVGEARGVGLVGALEVSPGISALFEQPGKVGARLATELLNHGVILRAIGDTLAFCPPMVITQSELDALFEPMKAALDATHAWVRAEGLMH